MAAGFVILLLIAFTFGNRDHEPDSHAGHDHAEGEHDEHGKEIVESSEIAQELAKIGTSKAAAKEIHRVVHLNGRIFPNQNKTARISARYPGVVKKVDKELGDEVNLGEKLASIEANGSLSVFSVISKISGTVIKKKIVSGEFVMDKDVLFEVSDLSSVWVNLNVTEQDFADIKEGQSVRIRMWDSKDSIDGNISYVSPLIHPDSQTSLVRVVIDNKSGIWRPGSFVTAEVTVESLPAEIAIDINAIQLVEDRSVVFVKVSDDTFEIRPVESGISGEKFVAILKGLKSGEEYVSKNSFVLKAEHLKSQAGHDHSH